MKTCSSCGESKPLKDYYKKKTNKDGHSGYCITCDKAKKAAHYLRTKDVYLARNKVWADANPEKTRIYKRNWKRKNKARLLQYKHKRRALESVEHFTGEEWIALLEFYGNVCLSCGSTENISADHITPLSLGGSNGIENIQPLCVPCNSKKGTSIIDYRGNHDNKS